MKLYHCDETPHCEVSTTLWYIHHIVKHQPHCDIFHSVYLSHWNISLCWSTTLWISYVGGPHCETFHYVAPPHCEESMWTPHTVVNHQCGPPTMWIIPICEPPTLCIISQCGAPHWSISLCGPQKQSYESFNGTSHTVNNSTMLNFHTVKLLTLWTSTLWNYSLCGTFKLIHHFNYVRQGESSVCKFHIV